MMGEKNKKQTPVSLPPSTPGTPSQCQPKPAAGAKAGPRLHGAYGWTTTESFSSDPLPSLTLPSHFFQAHPSQGTVTLQSQGPWDGWMIRCLPHRRWGSMCFPRANRPCTTACYLRPTAIGPGIRESHGKKEVRQGWTAEGSLPNFDSSRTEGVKEHEERPGLGLQDAKLHTWGHLAFSSAFGRVQGS